MTTRRDSPLRPGKLFEEQVAILLTLFGYSVEHDVRYRGSRVDVRATVDLPTHRSVLLVECKDHGRSIGIELVRSFFSIVAEAPSDVRGLYVAREGFTAEATEFAQSTSRLTLSTYRDLERKVIDPAHYFRRIISSYPQQPLATTYVDLRCRDSAGVERDSVEQVLMAEVHKAEVDLIVVLGEYGSGKSTLLSHLEYSLAASYVATGTGRIPLLVNLGEYTKAFSLRQLLTDLLVNRMGVRGPRYETLERLNEHGRLVFLFDGFDEMSSKCDDIVVRENFAEIQTLRRPQAKIVITCRTSFFRDREELSALLGPPADGFHDQLFDLAHASSVFELLPLNGKQIERIVQSTARLRKQSRSVRIDADSLLRRIRETYNLQDLAQRPFLLDMIIKSVPHVDHSARILTAGLLYDIYTEAWVHRDARKGRVLETAERRLFFAEELAVTMYTQSATLLHWRQIPEWIDRRLGIRDKFKDYYDYDVRSANFLSRNDQGYYYFAHRSFLEFFLARRLGKSLLADDLTLVSTLEVGEEARQFILDLYGNEVAPKLGDFANLLRVEGLRTASERPLIMNIIGLIRQAGVVRVIVPILVYLRQGPDRGLKAYFMHLLETLLREESDSPPRRAQAFLAAVAIVVRGSRQGLDPAWALRLWRGAPAVFRREARWVERNRRTSKELSVQDVLERIKIIEKGVPSVSTTEIAFSLAIPEDEVLKSLKHR